MAGTEVATSTASTAVASPTDIANIRAMINIADRSAISVFGDNAQQEVASYADKVLVGIRNRDIGDTGKLMSDIILKAKNLDPASIDKKGFLGGLFSSAKARLEKFKLEYEDVASQIDRICLDLDRHKDILRRDIAVLDDLHDETQASIIRLDGYIRAGKEFGENFRANELPLIKAKADNASASGSDGLLEGQAYQDALKALDRLEKRVFYLQQARQLGIQQLPQIRIVQSGDETLIESLQATSVVTINAWKQKMVILLGLNRQKSALELQTTVTDATNEMIRQASSMMKDQAIAIEKQSQRGIVDMETLAQANRDLIDTVGGVSKIIAEGRQKRADAEKQMEQMTADLKKALTNTPAA